MTALDELRPMKKALVMDLLEEAGFDISAWRNYKGVTPAANPKYCYNWSFEQPGEVVAVCLWHRTLKQKDGVVSYVRKPRGFGARGKGPAASVWNTRDAEFGKNLELAYRQQLPISVIVVEGERRRPTDLEPKASFVRARLLDPVHWAVTEYDYATGQCVLVRGVNPVIPAVDSSDLELSWFEGKKKKAFVYHRRREARARRAKIRDTLRNNGGRLICEVQYCGFDYVERYGALGKGYAQVHHLVPLSMSPKEGREIKLKELAVICANCHVMVHIGGQCRSLEGLIKPRLSSEPSIQTSQPTIP
jgi:5-methylcytosine-specific restriction enzyme A